MNKLGKKLRELGESLQRGLIRFMEGRNGLDEMGMALFGGSILVYFLALLFQNGLLLYVSFLMMGYEMFRCFSKNLWKRKRENEGYLRRIGIVKRYFTLVKLNWRDRKSYHYFLCHECGQLVRVPKLNRKVEISCPKCGNHFIKKA